MKKAENKEITVKFNGEEIVLVPFMEEMIKETITGMMSTLKGYEEDCDIEIAITDR